MSAWGVVFDLSVSAGYLLLFSAFWRLGGALGSVPGPILLGSWRVMLRPEVRRTLGSMLPRWFTAVLFLSKFETVLFGLAVILGPPASAWVVFNLWPVVFVLVMLLFFRSRSRYDSSLRSLLPVLALGLLGFLASGPARDLLSVLNGGSGALLLGSLLALSACLCVGVGNAAAFRLGHDFGERVARLGVPVSAPAAYTLGGLLFHFLSQVQHFLMFLPIGLAMGERASPGELLAPLLGGFFISGVGDLYYRRANVLARSLSVNGLVYASPVLGLLLLFLLFLLSVSGAARWPELTLGVLLVSLAGLLAGRGQSR